MFPYLATRPGDQGISHVDCACPPALARRLKSVADRVSFLHQEGSGEVTGLCVPRGFSNAA